MVYLLFDNKIIATTLYSLKKKTRILISKVVVRKEKISAITKTGTMKGTLQTTRVTVTYVVKPDRTVVTMCTTYVTDVSKHLHVCRS